MPFNVEQHANLGFIDRTIKEGVEKLAKQHKRTLRAQLEVILKEAIDNNK